ncbi:MAG TPA: HIT family protein [Alphaproteobacteria bacterium]|nr:HIT family protein [Alphaproteobacteria bacterium]
MHLDPRLEFDSTFVTDLKLCQVHLSHNAAFPWILLIPKQESVIEIIDLDLASRNLLMEEISLASQVMRCLFQPTKLNVASLGNIIPQLHIHVIVRYDNDPAWPNPVWNSGISTVYDSCKMRERIAQLQEAFSKLAI